jgi:OOP family OmpA-OmpF porin
MPSSNEHRALGFAIILLASSALSSRAGAQQQPQGFAVERFYPSAPGGGWFVMDDLGMRGGLGGVMALTAGYAMKPLRVTDGSQHIAVVSDQAFTDVGLAVTYDRWRLYLNLDAPLVTKGQSGTVGDYQFAGPSLDLGVNPDTLSDARIGLDARVLGGARSPFRLGAGAQLIVPNGNRSDYDTDGTYRAMGRVLFAGDVGHFTYAGQLGVHVRPLDDSPTPGSPQGSELLFGVAGGAKVPVCRNGTAALVVGPEIYGATAFRSFLGSTGTALEGLLTGRLEGMADDGPQLGVKLGTGAGISQHFGAPEWRLVFAIEVFDRNTDRDKDGISDSKDACPDTPGIGTHDAKTNGCPVDRDGDGIPDAEDACPDAGGPNTEDPKTKGCPAASPTTDPGAT